jgi:hypothetical protein
MPRKRKRWTFAAGEKGCTVTVYERRPGGPLHARAFDPKLAGGRGGYRRLSLVHRDRERAKTYALKESAKLREGRAEISNRRLKFTHLVADYLTYRTPRKAPDQQKEDKRRRKMWERYLGPQKDPLLISLGEWEAFVDVRSSGALDARGRAVPVKRRHAVRNRTVAADCLWLRQVLNWATKWRNQGGRYLLRENPVRGYPIPFEKNPRRPVASTDRYECLRKVSDGVQMEIRWNGHRESRRSYLSELLDLAQGTGRRITAISSLRYEDLRLNEGPQGSICWPADTDKTGRETVTPMSRNVRAAVDRVLRERPGIGRMYLFPSPKDRERAVSKDLASWWLKRAEQLAGLAKQEGSLWHAYRRAWVTARKHLPDVDVARVGGWKDVTVLRSCYQRPDDETILAVVEGGRELRERRA